MSGPLILVPKPVPPGVKVEVGQKYQHPACDRCLREGTERNPVLLSHAPERKSHLQRELARGVTRRDALCAECREYLKRGW